MAMKVSEIEHWLSQFKGSEGVGISDEGLALVSTSDPDAYLEVGGIPEPSEEEDLIYHQATSEESGLRCDECGSAIQQGDRIVERPAGLVSPAKYWHERCTDRGESADASL